MLSYVCSAHFVALCLFFVLSLEYNWDMWNSSYVNLNYWKHRHTEIRRAEKGSDSWTFWNHLTGLILLPLNIFIWGAGIASLALNMTKENKCFGKVGNICMLLKFYKNTCCWGKLYLRYPLSEKTQV